MVEILARVLSISLPLDRPPDFFFLRDKILFGGFTFPDALSFVRNRKLLTYPDPGLEGWLEKPKYDLQHFIDGPIRSLMDLNQAPSHEVYNIVALGVLMPSLRLAYVIEGIKKLIDHFEKNDYSKDKDRQHKAQEKISRLNWYLGRLDAFRLDTITDILVNNKKVPADIFQNWFTTRMKVKLTNKDQLVRNGDSRLISLVTGPLLPIDIPRRPDAAPMSM